MSDNIRLNLKVKDKMFDFKPSMEDTNTHDTYVREDTYPEALIKGFLKLPVSPKWKNSIKSHVFEHTTFDARKLFIPFCNLNPIIDSKLCNGISMSNVYNDARELPAQIYLENVNINSLNAYANNTTGKRGYKKLGNIIKESDVITEVTTEDYTIFNKNTQKFYAIDKDYYLATTEGMNITQFYNYCEENYRKIVQSFFDTYPEIVNEISDFRTKLSYLTGKRIDSSVDIFNIRGIDKCLEQYLDDTIDMDKYATIGESTSRLSMKHIENSGKFYKDKNIIFGPLYKIGKYLVTPANNRYNSALEMYVLLHDKEDKDKSNMQYVKMNINTEQALFALEESFRYTKPRYVYNVEKDDRGVITTEGYVYLLTTDFPEDTMNNHEVLEMMNDYLNQTISPYEKILSFVGITEEADKEDNKEDIKDKAVEKGKEVAQVATQKTSQMVDDVKDMASDLKSKFKESSDKDEKQIALNDNMLKTALATLRRNIRTLAGPTLIGTAILGPIGTLIGLIVGLAKRKSHAQLRQKVYDELMSDIHILDEKIKDCGPDENSRKYTLMKIQSRLQREAATIRANSIKA